MDETSISEVLSSFHSERDYDVEQFLKSKAIVYHENNKARTYLVCDFDSLESGNFEVLAYFSLALSTIDFSDDISNRKRSQIDGLFGKKKGLPIKSAPVYLIGQLAKNDACPKSFDGSSILDYAISVNDTANSMIGGNAVLVECKPIPKVQRFYMDNGFTLLSTTPDEEGLIQFIRFIG